MYNIRIMVAIQVCKTMTIYIYTKRGSKRKKYSKGEQ